MALCMVTGILLALFTITTYSKEVMTEDLSGKSAITKNKDNTTTTQAMTTEDSFFGDANDWWDNESWGYLVAKATNKTPITTTTRRSSTIIKNTTNAVTTPAMTGKQPFFDDDWEDESTEKSLPAKAIIEEWLPRLITSQDVSGYALDELLYNYLQTEGGKRTLESAKPVLYDLLEGALFPSEDESNDDKRNDTTRTTTSSVIKILQESLLPMVQIIFTPDEKGTSCVDDIIAVFDSYLNESFGSSKEPAQIFGISLDPKTANGETFLRLTTKFLRTNRITVPLADYLMQVLKLALKEDNNITFKDALLEAAIHELSHPSSEDLLKGLTVFLLKDVILDSTDLVSCGLTSALERLLTALSGNASTSITEMKSLLTNETMEKLRNLGKDTALQALDLADTRTTFKRLKHLFTQHGLPLPGDKLVFILLRAAVNSGGVGNRDSLSLANVLSAIKASGLNLSKIAESLIFSIITSKDAPLAFFNIFDTFSDLAREVPTLSNLPNMNFVDRLADFL